MPVISRWIRIPFICYVFALFSSSLVLGMNPEKRRTVVLESVRKIMDDGKELIFKAPRCLSVDDEGSIYFAEGPFVYKYKDGRMVFRAGKLGQGPGECQLVYSYALFKGTLCVQAAYPPKFLNYSATGEFLKDRKGDHFNQFFIMFSANGELYGLRDEMFSHPERMRIEGEVESEFSVNRISPDYKKITRFFDFPILLNVKNGRWTRAGQLKIAVHDPYVFILHSNRYQIDRVDLRSGLVDKSISRKFVSKKDEFDIIHICFYGDLLWVFTSERARNGTDRLIDVYDIDGALIDAFYLHLPDVDEDYHIGTPVISRDGIFSIIQENQTDGFLSIGQYKIR